MSVTIDLSGELEAHLQERAAEAGTDLQGFILQAVAEKLEEPNNTSAVLSYEEWSQDFRSWVQSHSSRNPNLDDRRESIYD